MVKQIFDSCSVVICAQTRMGSGYENCAYQCNGGWNCWNMLAEIKGEQNRTVDPPILQLTFGISGEGSEGTIVAGN